MLEDSGISAGQPVHLRTAVAGQEADHDPIGSSFEQPPRAALGLPADQAAKVAVVLGVMAKP